MCLERYCLAPQVQRCKIHEKTLEGLINLASKGFTVTEIQCNLDAPLEHPDSNLWEYVCTKCAERFSEQEKQTCPHRKHAEKIVDNLKNLGFAVIDMFCQYDVLRSIWIFLS